MIDEKYPIVIVRDESIKLWDLPIIRHIKVTFSVFALVFSGFLFSVFLSEYYWIDI